MPHITFFTKPGCHLCDAVEQVIRRVQRDHPFELSIRNILNDSGDFGKYQYDIPVVLLDDREIARYRLTETDLIAALAVHHKGGGCSRR